MVDEEWNWMHEVADWTGQRITAVTAVMEQSPNISVHHVTSYSHVREWSRYPAVEVGGVGTLYSD